MGRKIVVVLWQGDLIFLISHLLILQETCLSCIEVLSRSFHELLISFAKDMEHMLCVMIIESAAQAAQAKSIWIGALAAYGSAAGFLESFIGPH